MNGQIVLLTIGKDTFEFIINDEFDDFYLKIKYSESSGFVYHGKGKKLPEAHHRIAGLMQLEEEIGRLEENLTSPVGKAYTREGMIQRVLNERKQKAKVAKYRIQFAENPYGEHLLINEKGKKYYITLRNPETGEGYCSCMDYASNKLGVCKHLNFAWEKARKKFSKKKWREAVYPFLEIALEPTRDYQISWYFAGSLPAEMQAIIDRYFGGEKLLSPDAERQFLRFITEAEYHKNILIRPEVLQRIEKAHDKKMFENVAQNHEMDLSEIKAKLYPHQLEGVRFAAYKPAVIIADEMGLGKTLQAITTAIVKKQAFGIERTLIICPASLKNQWKNEIEKFSQEKAMVVEGLPKERQKIYEETDAFFLIINYETVLRDGRELNKHDIDFIILDEAQRIKNYETQTARSIKRLNKKHALVITGTPIENRLTDLFSIMDFLDPEFLNPLWEFSYQHCYFDEHAESKIVGYYNLQALKERMKPYLLRRIKREVIRDLPNITQLDIPLDLHEEQKFLHSGYAKALAKVIRKKYLNAFDMNRIIMLMNNMRMVCDSTFLVDQNAECHYSPKLIELEHILTEKLDVLNQNRKVIIFSEWVKMNGLIGRMLRKNNINYVELSGRIPVKNRQKLVDEFYQNPDCNVFLSSEAGGTGLNLQVADTVINFELPWNPAKKNQRIGRIDRLGQEADHLTVINLICRDSIEMKIAAGLELKQNLFEGVLDESSELDKVDFSAKGKAQFLKQLEAILDEMLVESPSEANMEAQEGGKEEEELVPAVISSESKPSEGGIGDTSNQSAGSREEQAAQLEQVMNQGMNFLSGIFQMATGKQLNTSEQKIEVDRETGEVVMRFKLPM